LLTLAFDVKKQLAKMKRHRLGGCFYALITAIGSLNKVCETIHKLQLILTRQKTFLNRAIVYKKNGVVESLSYYIDFFAELLVFRTSCSTLFSGRSSEFSFPSTLFN
jgi:hypothetical protein